MTREVPGKIWIEHGQQHDERNHILTSQPLRPPMLYFITTA